MSDNDAAYAAGLLNRALDPANQPPEVRAFLRDEETLVSRLVPEASTVVDLGCGEGRHLRGMADRLALGVGVDYELAYVARATEEPCPGNLHFMVGDATAVPLTGPFDLALCLTNTWGTMSDKAGVLSELRRLSPRLGSRIITVYAPESVEARRAWYANLGHEVVEATEEWLETANGFRSEHFSRERIHGLVGPCTLHPVGEMAYVMQV